MDQLKSGQIETWSDKALRSRVLVTEMLYHNYDVTHIVVVVSIWLVGTNLSTIVRKDYALVLC